MRMALEEAQKARDLGEVPIGAVVVKDGIVVGHGFNKTETLKDPTAHAEMEAIRMLLEVKGKLQNNSQVNNSVVIFTGEDELK